MDNNKEFFSKNCLKKFFRLVGGAQTKKLGVYKRATDRILKNTYKSEIPVRMSKFIKEKL